MDFHELPRRDLQALCKRNGLRANMTNAAMADALGALPAVDGVEEYVKQSTAQPERAGKAAVAEEEVRREKQGSPLPRGRRVTAKTSEVVKVDDGKGKEGQKADAKREEDAPALGVGRRGASRRTQPAPVVAAPAAEPAVKAATDKQVSPPPRARRQPAKPDDGTEKEDLKLEANKQDAPVQGGARRGPSRRARPAPVVAALAAEPETKVAAEEKHGSPLPRARRATPKPPEPARPDDSVEEDSNDDVPAQAVGQCGPSRRARPAPVVSKPAAKAALEEELGSPLPRGRRVIVKSSAPISTEGGEDEKEDMQREAIKGNSQALGVGRRNASRCARPEAAVSAPADNVPAEEDAPIPRRRRGKVKASVPITLNSGEEEGKEKLEEKEEAAPAHGVTRRGPSRRAHRALVEAPATRRRDAKSTTDERDVPVETVLIRPTRERKPTMKAAAAAEEKVPRRPTKKAAAMNSTLQTEKQQEEPQEVVPASVSDEACYDKENVEEAADPQNLEQSKVIDEQRQDDEEVVMNEDEILMDETPAEKSSVTDEILMEESLTEEPPAIDEECMGNSAVEKEECKEKAPVEEQQVDVEPCCSILPSLEDSPVLGLISMFAEQTVEKDEGARFQEGAGPSEGQLYKGMGEENHHADEEMEMVPLIQALQAPLTADDPTADVGFTDHADYGSKMDSSNSMQGTEDITTVDAEDGLVCQEKGNVAYDEAEEQPNTVDEAVIVDCSGNIISAVEETEMVPLIQSLQPPLTADEPTAVVGYTGHVDHGGEMDSSNRVQGTEDITTVDAEDGLVCQENGDVTDVEVEEEFNTVDEAIIVDCSGNIISAVEEKKAVETVVSEPVHNEGVISDNVTQFTLRDGKSDGMEKAELVTDELPQGSAKLDVNGEEDTLQSDFVRVDEHKLVDGENAELVTDKLAQSRAKMDEDVEDDYFQSDFVHVDEEKLVVDEEKAHVTATMDEDVEEDFQTDCVPVDEQKDITNADSMQDVIMDGDIVVEKLLIIKEMQQSIATMDEEDIDDDQLETDFVLAEKQKEVATADKAPKLRVTDGEVDGEEKDVEITQEAPQSVGTMDECVQEGYFENYSVHADEPEKVFTADNVLEVTKTEEEDVSGFNGDLCPEDIDRDYSDHITSALLDNITESLSMITITEPSVPRNEDVPMCKNSSEKNTAEPVCKNISDKNTNEPVSRNVTEKNTDELVCESKSEKNTAELVAMQENMGAKVAKKSADLKDLSLGQLRVKYKKTLEGMKAKRVALARVDENVCRSNATGHEMVRKLQQYLPGEEASSEL